MIIDAKWGRAIVAGDNYDGHLYHQDPRNRDNAKWMLIPAGGHADYYNIKDMKHGMYIVSGRNYDGHVYHQSGADTPNARWRVEKVVDKNGLGLTAYLIDEAHGKAIVAGDQEDNHVYHQNPGDRPNARWSFVRTSLLPCEYSVIVHNNYIIC